MNNVLETLKRIEFYDEEYVVLACSYGPDSMCLLDLLKKFEFKVVVAHINHKLRVESDKEYDDLKKYCDDNGFIFEGISIEEYPKENVEAYARSFRYDFFKKIVKKYNARYLFTAHHGDDLTETILMRLVRGASFRGYAGFRALTKCDDYILVRPLIYIDKDEILNYVDTNGIPYAIDKTNLELVHTRNKYRHNVLPVLKDINPRVNDKFLKFSDMINEYNDYVQNEVESLYSNLYINNRIDINEFNILPLLLRKELINRILLGIYNDNINRITDEHVNMILNLCDNDKVNAKITLPCSVIVRKFYNIIEFTKEEKVSNFDYILDSYVYLGSDSISIIRETDIIKSNYLIRLNSKDLVLPIHVRNRRIGDVINLKNGRKSVGEILSEAKIPQHKRNMIPIVTDNDGKILWIPGVKKSKFDKQLDEEYDIILKYIKKENNNEEK